MQRFAGTFISFLVLLGVAANEPVLQRRLSNAPRRRTEAADIPAAKFSIPIAATVPRSKAKKSLRENLKANSGLTSPLAGGDFDQEYLLNVTIGGQNFSLIFDTGSSDTWVPDVGFSCISLEGTPTSAATCDFGTSGFNVSLSPTFKVNPNTNFNITYGDNRFVTGTVGFDTVQVGGLAVSNQEFGLVTQAGWIGDGVSSGLLGVAAPNLTHVYSGTDPIKDGLPTKLPYNSFFYTAVQENLVLPYFSIALDRGSVESESSSAYDPGLGFVSFGGIAPVAVTNTTVTVPVQRYEYGTFSPENGPNGTYLFYAVDVEAFSFSGSNISISSNNTILDSGTTLDFVPTPIADAFSAAFDPPAVFNDTVGGYVTLCSAKVPEFTVTIGGTTFTTERADQLFPLGIQNSQGQDLCVSGTTDGGAVVDGNVFILGDTFLHNVVATFDIKEQEITLTQRQPYSSGGSLRRAVRRSL